jgi:hypothetical protein
VTRNPHDRIVPLNELSRYLSGRLSVGCRQ